MIKCDVIKDLLPLYHDKVVSNESCKLIETHIENCPNCREFLKELQHEGVAAHINIDCAEIGAFKKMKKKIFRKTILVTAIASIMVLVLAGAYFNSNMPISYHEANIALVEPSTTTVIREVYDENGMFVREYEPEERPILAVTSLTNVSGSSGVERDVNINDETVRVIYFQLIRARVTGLDPHADTVLSFTSEIWLTDVDGKMPFDRVEVYYTASPLRRLNAMNDDDFLAYRNSATLLWSGTI